MARRSLWRAPLDDDNYDPFYQSLYAYDKLRILMLWQTMSILLPCPDIVAIVTRLFMDVMSPARWFYSPMTEQYYRLQDDIVENERIEMSDDGCQIIDVLAGAAGILKVRRGFVDC